MAFCTNTNRMQVGDTNIYMRVAIREMSSWVSSSVRGKFVQVGRNVALVYALIVGLMSVDELVEMLSMDELHHGRDAPPEKIN